MLLGRNVQPPRKAGPPPASLTAARSSHVISSPLVLMLMSGDSAWQDAAIFSGPADKECMPGLGEEAPVGERVVVAVVGRVLQEDAYAVRLIEEPGEEGRHELNVRPPASVAPNLSTARLTAREENSPEGALG